MNSQLLVQLAQLSTVIVGVIGLGVSLRSHRRQMHAQMFIEFSSRVHSLLKELPVETWSTNGREDAIPPRSEELTKACMQCFRVIADLHHLHRAGYISQDLWRPWQQGLQRVMQGPVLRREWLALEPGFDHQAELVRYMRALIAGKPPGRGHRSSRVCPRCRELPAHAVQK